MTTSRSSRRRSQAAAAAAAAASSHINASLHASPSNLQPLTRRSTIATSTSTSTSVATASAVASTSPAAATAAAANAPSSAPSSSLPSHHSHEPEQEMSSAIKGGHSLRRRKTVDYGENAASAAPHGAASSSSLGHLDSAGRDIGYRTRTQTGAVAKTRKRIVDDDSGEDDVPAAKRRNGTSSSSSTSATAPTPSAAPPSLTPRKNPTRASRRPPKSSRFVDSDSEDNQAQQDTPASSRPSRLRAAANGKGTKKTMARSSSSSTAHSHPSDAEQSHDESSAPSDDGCQDGGPDDQDSDTDLSESIMPHRRSTVGPKLPSNERRFPSILPLNLSTGSLLGSPKEQAKMYRDASEYHQRVPELDVVRALPDGQQEVYRTRNYRLKQGERVYQAVSDPLRNINGSIKSKYSKTLLQSSSSSSPSFSSSLRQRQSLSQPQPLSQPQETRKSSRQSRKAKGRAAATGATGAPAADTAPTTDAAKLSACVSAASPSAIGSRYSSALSSLPPAAEDSPQPLGVVDGFWKAHRLSQRDANQCHREALASAPTSSSALASAPAPENRAGTFSSSDSPISSMSSSSNPLAAPYTTWEAYVDDWTLQPESRIPEVEEKEEDEDAENDADGGDDEGLAEDEDGAVEPMPGSQQLTSAVATSRVASSDEADEASDNRLFLFRKLPDITDIVNTLQNHDDMDYDQLVHSIDAVNKILYQYQNEFVATTAVVDDWENAQRRATDDINAEKLLVPKEFLLKGYSTKSMTAKESEIHAVRMMDRLMADVYFFRHDPHISKVGRQDPLDQPHEAAPNHGDVRRSLRNDPNKTAKGTDHADPNIITGKRMRKPREMFDGQPNSRSATPALQTVSKRSTRSRRGEDEPLDSNPGANSVSGSFNSNASFSGPGATAAAASGLSEAHQKSSTPSTPVPAHASAPSLSTPTKKGKPDSGPNPRKRRRIKNEEPAPAVEEPASEYEELEREEEKVPEPEPAPEPAEEEEPPRKRRVRRTKAQIAADKAAAEAAQAQAQAEAEAEAESEATAAEAASSTVPPSAATSDFEADDEPAKKRIVSLMVPNLHVVRGSSTTSSKTTTPASTGKRGRKGKSSGKDAPTPPVNGSGRRKASNTIQPSPPTFTPNDNIAGPPSGPVVFPGAQPPPNHNGQIMWNSNPNKHNKPEGGSGRGRGRGGRRSTGGASHASQNSPLAQSQAPQPAQSPIDSSHMQQLPPHSQSQVPPPHLMHMQNQPMYDNKQPPLSHMPTIIAHYPPLQHQHQHQHQHQLPPHSIAPQSGNGGGSSHPVSHHHSHSQTPPYGGSHIQYAPKTQFIQHSHTMPPQHSHVPMHGHSHPPLGHSHGHSHSHSHGHNNSHGMPPPPPVAASAGIPTSGSQINGSAGPDGDNRVRIKMVKPNQKPINLDNVVMGSKEYAQMTKSEKMSHSMKNRWKSGSMQGAVDKRKATLARKKQDRDPAPGNSSNSNSSRAVNGTPAARPTDNGSPTQSAHPIAYANPNSVAPMPLYPHHSQPQHMHSHSQIPPPPPQQRGQHPHGIFITQPPQSGYPQQGQQKQHVNLPPPPMGPQLHQQPHPSQQQEQMNTLNISRYPPSQP